MSSSHSSTGWAMMNDGAGGRKQRNDRPSRLPASRDDFEIGILSLDHRSLEGEQIAAEPILVLAILGGRFAMPLEHSAIAEDPIGFELLVPQVRRVREQFRKELPDLLLAPVCVSIRSRSSRVNDAEWWGRLITAPSRNENELSRRPPASRSSLRQLPSGSAEIHSFDKICQRLSESELCSRSFS